MFRSQRLLNYILLLSLSIVLITSLCLLPYTKAYAQVISLDKLSPQLQVQSILSSGYNIDSLTPAQCQTIEAELSKRGGQAPPEAAAVLKKCNSLKELKTGNNVEEEIAPGEEEKTGIKTEKDKATPDKKEETVTAKKEDKTIQLLERFGLNFFKPARNRIVTLEEMIGKGQRPQSSQKDAVSGFVGPLEMVSSYVNATVPPQYVLSPGDKITVYYWGELIELTDIKLQLDEKGEVSIPKAGRMVARGMTLSQLQNAVRDQLQRVLGKNISVIATLDSLRSIQIFITGEAFRPGSYAVSAVTTLFNALYASGGPSDYGSLRDIRLIRNNKTITIDLYSYLLKGDSGDDYPLQGGDTIFISKAGKLVSIEGEVNRPAIYELKGDEKLKNLIALANEIKPTGLLQKVQIRSVIPNKERVISDVDISKTTVSSNYELFDGDSVIVASILPEVNNVVTIEGKVERPGIYELKKAMRVSDLFSEINQPLGEAYLEKAAIVRLNEDKKTTTLILINLGKALSKDPDNDIKLAPMDKLIIYSKLDIQFFPPRIVTIAGAVQKPGNYDRPDGMTINDLIINAGGVLPDTYLDRADLLRYDFENGSYKNLSVNINKALEGNKADNIVLQDKDSLRLYSLKDIDFTPPHEVSIFGAVQKPGTYTRFEGMRLSDLLRISGGILPGGVEKLEIAKARSEGEVKIIKSDLESLNNGDQSQDVLLDDEDIIMVRKKSDFYDKPVWVTISGEVKYPGVYSLKGKEDKIRDIIERAGGLTRYAYAKGTVFTRKRENFPSDEQRKDVVIANKIADALNNIEYTRQLARNQWLMQKEGGKKDLSQASGTGVPVVATSGTPAQAAAIGLAPGVSQAAGQVAGGIIETFEKAPGIVSNARRLGEGELSQSARVIVNLDEALNGGEENIILMDGDTIDIPQRFETVSVVGAVTRPTTIHFISNSRLQYFVDKSGGFTSDADAKGVMVMRADGSIIPAKKVKYLEEGDIVYVPPRVMSLDIVERIDKIIDVVKFTLVTTASVVVFVALIGLF